MDPVPLAGFVHLDDYSQPIRTEVAHPALVTPRSETATISEAIALPEWERWPPTRIPFLAWGVYSVFAVHCQWLVDHVPTEYLQQYWDRAPHRIPALGHLHFLYDERGLHDQGGADGVGRVDLPPDLCICDCPLTPTPPGEITDAGTLRLVSRCIQDVFQWTVTTIPELEGRLPGVRNTNPEAWARAVIACCHCTAAGANQLASGLRDAALQDNRWLQETVEASGVTADLDGILLQCAYLWTAGDHWCPEAAIGLWLAISGLGGPLTEWIPAGTPVCVSADAIGPIWEATVAACALFADTTLARSVSVGTTMGAHSAWCICPSGAAEGSLLWTDSVGHFCLYGE